MSKAYFAIFLFREIRWKHILKSIFLSTINWNLLGSCVESQFLIILDTIQFENIPSCYCILLAPLYFNYTADVEYQVGLTKLDLKINFLVSRIFVPAYF